MREPGPAILTWFINLHIKSAECLNYGEKTLLLSSSLYSVVCYLLVNRCFQLTTLADH
jgi:hypothetical protein